jgi:hypothetical protein
VKAALLHPMGAGKSDSDIARYVGCSDTWVGQIRAALVSSNRLEDRKQRKVTRNGTTYQQNTTNIGKRKPDGDTPAATERPLESHADTQTAAENENGSKPLESEPKPKAEMEEIGTYQCHPVTRIVPRMTPEEFAGLVDSIRSRGLIDPIARLDGLILDGRERLRACLYAGVEPRFKDLTDCDSPVTYIMSANYYRQHLTPAEIAAVKAKLSPPA